MPAVGLLPLTFAKSPTRVVYGSIRFPVRSSQLEKMEWGELVPKDSASFGRLS